MQQEGLGRRRGQVVHLRKEAIALGEALRRVTGILVPEETGTAVSVGTNQEILASELGGPQNYIDCLRVVSRSGRRGDSKCRRRSWEQNMAACLWPDLTCSSSQGIGGLESM